jgi:hypothetical protein
MPTEKTLSILYRRSFTKKLLIPRGTLTYGKTNTRVPQKMTKRTYFAVTRTNTCSYNDFSRFY